MVDLMQVLEGATYLAFIVGAIVAVFELRDIKRDRGIETLTRLMEHGATRDFQGPMAKVWRLKTTNPQEIEEEISCADLHMLVEFWSIAGYLVTSGLVDAKILLEYFDYVEFWKRVGPWIVNERNTSGSPKAWDPIDTLARMQASRAQS